MDLQVIIPSRGNPYGLICVVNALANLQSDAQRILYTIVADRDDETTILAAMKCLKDVDKHEMVLTELFKKDADANLNGCLNNIANRCDAELTMVLCDDVIPLTQRWDWWASLIKAPVFGWKELNNPNSFTYPCVTKQWRHLTGYVLCDRFPFWFADSWSAEVFQLVTNCPVPIMDNLVLGGRRGETRGMHDLAFWFRYWKVTRKVRVAEAEAIKGEAIDEKSLAPFLVIDQVHDGNIEEYCKIHGESKTPRSKRYLAARSAAEKWMYENMTP